MSPWSHNAIKETKRVPPHLARFVEAAKSIVGVTGLFQLGNQMLKAAGALYSPD